MQFSHIVSAGLLDPAGFILLHLLLASIISEDTPSLTASKAAHHQNNLQTPYSSLTSFTATLKPGLTSLMPLSKILS